jgi:hypothetical protein
MASVSTPKYNLKDLGMPMYPSGFNRLMAVDLEGVKLRYYSKKDFFWVVNKLKYNDLNALNKDVVLGRQVTEAAWLKVLLRTYTKWDPKELSKKFPGEEMKEKKRMLREALFEVSSCLYSIYSLLLSFSIVFFYLVCVRDYLRVFILCELV